MKEKVEENATKEEFDEKIIKFSHKGWKRYGNYGNG